MSCSGVYILDSKGKSLISRNYRGDVETSDVDKFMTLVMEKEEEGITSPIIGMLESLFCYIQRCSKTIAI